MLWDIKGTFVLGGLLLLVGAAIMVGAWPETSVYGSSFLDEPVVSESGSEAWVFVGAIVAMVGQVLVAIAVIASGVRIGLDTTPTRQGATPVP